MKAQTKSRPKSKPKSKQKLGVSAKKSASAPVKTDPVPASVSVLIVEDVEDMRLLLEEMIRGADLLGLRLSGSASSVIEARLELDRRRPDLVLLDEILPGESSDELLADLVRDGIPVLLMTSMEEPNHALGEGALGRITKPGWKSLELDRARIAAEIRGALERDRTPPGEKTGY